MKIKLFLILISSLFILTSGLAQWQQTGGPNGGPVNALAVDPATNYIFAGTYGGVYLSNNNGNSWVAVNNGLTRTSISSLAISGGNIFAGTNGGGVFLSSNNGASWTTINTGLTSTYVNTLVIDGGNIYAGTDGGVFLSSNNGSSWTAVNNGLTSTSISSLAISGSNIFACNWGGGIFVSSNNGGSWAAVNTGLTNTNVFKLAASGSNIFAGTFGGGVFSSSNNGVSWTSVNNGLTNTEISSLTINGNNIFAGTWSGGVFLSSNNGSSWTAVNNGLTGDYFATMAISGSTIFTGSSAGVFLSTNNGSSWTSVNNGLTNSYVRSLAINGINIFAGTDGGGVSISSNNGGSWTAINTGLVSTYVNTLAISGSNIFAATYGGVFLSSNNGNSWAAVNNGLTNTDVRSLAISGSNIFAGTSGGVFLSSNNGSSWTAINNGLTSTSISSLVISGSNIFACNWGGGIFVSSNSGGSWTAVNNGLTNLNVTKLAVSGSNIFAGTQSGIFLSSNNGVSWTAVNNGIPATYINSLTTSGGNIFAGSDGGGLFISTDNGSNWKSANNGLPNNSSILTVVDDENYLYAGVPYFGVWKRPLAELFNLSVSTNTLTIAAPANSTKTFNISSTINWSVISDQSWLKVNTSSGANNATITLTADVNPTNATRTAIVSVSGSGVATQTITVTQDAGTNAAYVSSTSTQRNTTKAFTNQSNQLIIGVEIVTSGNLNPLSTTSFTFNTTGSTAPATDISNAKLYYTGNSNAYAPTTQFGVASISPNGTFIITGSQALSEGVNYFWLTYDVPTTAVVNNYLDAQCTLISVGADKTPSNTNPSGSRIIAAGYCTTSITYNDEYIANVKVGTIDNSSTLSAGGYADYTYLSTDIVKGTTLKIDIINGKPYFATDQSAVWVDWNNNGDFSDDQANIVTGSPGIGPYSTTVTCPAGATIGAKRMRIRLVYNTAPIACGNSEYGETEDYTINVINAPGCYNAMNYLASNVQTISSNYFDLASTGIAIATNNFDDANSAPQEIGFPFRYNCQQFTNFVLNTNGFIKLGSSSPSSAALFFDGAAVGTGGVFNSTNFSDINIISPFNHDLTSGTMFPEYRVNTSGIAPNRICTIQFKNVRDKTTTPAQQYDNMQFQIKLYETSNIIEFVYGEWMPSINASAFKTAGCGLKGSGITDNQLLEVAKSSSQEWNNVTYLNMAGRTLNFGNPTTRPKPNLGQTYRFIPVYENDLAVKEIYALGDASVNYSNPQIVSANIANTGLYTMNNVPVTLTIAGANSFTDTKNIAVLNPGENIKVAFSSFTASIKGTTSIKVNVPSDDNNENNLKTWTQNTNDFICKYATEYPNTALGILSTPEISYTKYHVTGSAKVSSVNTYIYNYPNNIGQTVFGVLLDKNGVVIGRSANYVIQPADLGKWHTFSIDNLPVITDDDYYTGFGQTASINVNYYHAIGVQYESPIRSGSYYKSLIDGTGLVPLDTLTHTWRYMIGATLAPNPPIAGTAASNSPICTGVASNLTLTGYYGTIQWQQSADGTTNWANVSGGTGATAANYTTGILSTSTFYRAEVSRPALPPVYSNILQVVVNPFPVSAGIITGKATVCQEQNNIAYSVPVISNATSYIWTLPTGASGTSTTNSININFSNTAVTGNITVKGSNSCGVGAISTISVKVNPPLPGTAPISGTTTVCQGQNSVLYSVGTVKNASNYIWTLPKDASGTSTLDNINVNFGYSAASGDITVRGSNACGEGAPTSISVNVKNKPATPTIIQKDLVLQADASSGIQWYYNGIFNGSTNQNLPVAYNGNYYVIVTANGCYSLPSNSIDILNVGIESNLINKFIKVYPNPVNNELNIEIGKDKKPIDFEIFNPSGKVVYSGKLVDKKTIQTSDFSPGVYLIRFATEGSFDYRKVIKE